MRSPIEQALLDIRKSTHQSVQLQTMQTGLLMQMSSTMSSIHREIAEIKRQNAEALAVQQELLVREQLQAYLEEFIYQGQRLVEECTKTATDIPPTTRYFLLRAVLLNVKQEGIATPIIKGRDNKAAFDRMMQETRELLLPLSKDPEVVKALAWAEELEKRQRLEREREQQELERLQKEMELKERREQRERELRMQEAAEERRKSNQRTLQIVAIALAGVFGLFILGCLGLCVLGQIANVEKRHR